ncbi:hypothetical protein [Thermoflexus hugenholtzii]|uniref:IgGFc-binding protein N-terminal domain-containing protein n=1 Tax=Thermoflexus hugenholtzii JAD2 TaxID=877466 RepID=A0A212RI15_9CHLR|nr:hypothetical protein [Thermoflexus hugenholtzii]SNB71872.1 hypothetical protein SAMN02746019_00015200 [Thermoflexus hugenholtzii JAD2]
MKNIQRVARAILVILFASVGAAPTSALPSGTWNTGIKVQNLSFTSSANIIVTLFNQDGSIAYTLDKTANNNLLQAPPGGSVEIYLPNYPNVSSGKYSAVVSSDQPIGVIATHTNYDYGLADSYNGMEGATQVYVPYVYHNHNYWSTEIFVQNTSDSVVAHVYATFSDGSKTLQFPLVLPPHGMGSFDTSRPEYDVLGWFIGSAIITSTENVPLSVLVNESRIVGAGNANGNVLVSFRGLTQSDAGKRVVLPSLYKEFSGVSGTWRSGIKIQNTTTSSVTVTVTFLADPDSPTGPWMGKRSNLNIPALGSVELYLRNAGILDGGASIPNMFKGYGIIDVIEPTDGKVVATVIHTNYEASGGKGVAVGYFGMASGASRLSFPSLYGRWPSGAGQWVSGIKIQNIGTITATVTVNFMSDPDISNPSWVGQRSGILLGPGQAIELYLANPILDGGQYVPPAWKGSALVTCSEPGCELVGTVIHANYGRNVANMYMAIPIK